MRYTWIDGIYVEVEGCHGCPFYAYNGDDCSSVCGYPHRPSEVLRHIRDWYAVENMGIPEDCPLRVKV